MSNHPYIRVQPPQSALSSADTVLLDRYAAHLERRGHTASTSKAYRKAVVHFLQWHHIAAPALAETVSTETVRVFLDEHLPACRCITLVVRSRKSVRAALNQLLSMNCQPRVIQRDIPPPTAIEASVIAFDDYLRDVCGLAVQTRRGRCREARQFLSDMFGAGPLIVDHITPSVLVDYVTDRACRARGPTATALVGALRSYLRFLRFDGTLVDNLEDAIPSPARWSLAVLPPALDDEQLARFWSVFDRTTAIGKRDYAMARCLADMALRCHEVAQLDLESIDWRGGVLTLAHNKVRRVDRLPLPASTGESLVDYLRYGRPASSSRALFVYHRAPLGQAVAVTTVRGAIRRAFQRAKLPWSGTHVLRHTAARRMLQSSCSIKNIADVLRHRSIDTTAIYTKVDLPQLTCVAQPWPEEWS
ncbi:tyrosine-type recombinase/integrase [Halomonas alkalisoli]|uniref:tyrosine-type recombinase/integrase n=1 Tax=Halomonas alkalisoli TaxID=2907158 RepID=UPI001F308064|nr:tyrosine-type recombinase/integrase [Halomonas alkalisoli]MCE9681689.1 tyrosine-type recombinase/integrase [Halomonas alkalisoli]